MPTGSRCGGNSPGGSCHGHPGLNLQHWRAEKKEQSQQRGSDRDQEEYLGQQVMEKKPKVTRKSELEEEGKIEQIGLVCWH